MQIVFLGTSCAKPTKERNHSGIFISYGSEGILMDCGEGTQRQMIMAGIRPTKINKILITHWHGDHVLGLPGLIQTLGISEYGHTLKIYGPAGTKKFLEHMFKSSVFEQNIEIEIKEIKHGKFYDGKHYILEAYPLDHSTATLGYRFVEKDRHRIKLSFTKKLGIPEGPLLGKLQNGEPITWKGKKIIPENATTLVKGKIVAYIPDSLPSKNSLKLAENADILISDSTYSSDLEEKAEDHKHLTAHQAASIANQANAKKLILTHFSTRYKDTSELEDDAKHIFNNVSAAKDFMKINI